MKFSIIVMTTTLGLTLAAPVTTDAAALNEMEASAKNLIHMVSDIDYNKRDVKSENSEATIAAAKNLIDMVSDLDYYKRAETVSEDIKAAAKNLLDMVSDLDYYKRSEAAKAIAYT
jgi:hypothetical protein